MRVSASRSPESYKPYESQTTMSLTQITQSKLSVARNSLEKNVIITIVPSFAKAVEFFETLRDNFDEVVQVNWATQDGRFGANRPREHSDVR